MPTATAHKNKDSFLPTMCKNKDIYCVYVWLLLLNLPSMLSAQMALPSRPIGLIFKERAQMATAIVQGAQKPAEVLEKLRTQAALNTRSNDALSDFSVAALDMGHRLIARGKPVEAEMFFRAAEKSLTEAIKTTPDTRAQAKAQYYQLLAEIRGYYLNDSAGAKSDIEHAVALQPENKHLQSVRNSLAHERGERIRNELPTTTVSTGKKQ